MQILGNWKSQHWVILEKIRYALCLSDDRFCELLGLTRRQYRSLRTRGAGIPVNAAFRLSEFTYVDFEKIMTGKIDFEVLAANFENPNPVLPKRYSRGAYSKVRSSFHYLEYIRSILGAGRPRCILKRLQVRPESIRNQDTDISVLFLDDLCHELLQIGITERQLFEIAHNSVTYNRNSTLGSLLRSEGTVKKVYERVFAELIYYFDENSVYSLTELTDQVAKIKCVQNENTGLAIGPDLLGSSLRCINLAGIGASFPRYLHRPNATVRKTQCVYTGDPHCVFEFHYNDDNVRCLPRHGKYLSIGKT